MRRSNQLELALHRGTWGGRRPGAGRKPGPDPRVAHRARPKFRRGVPCHVTLKVREGLPSLRTRRFVAEIERSFAEACERGEARLVHYSIQSNHAHLIVEAADSSALGRLMRSLAARFARAVNRVFEQSGRVLADHYHLHVLRSPREVRYALRYVLLNATRHRTRSRPGAALDPASSARFFDGWRGTRPLGIATGCPVARPRGWLLARGWRRHGLLDAADVPGPC